MKKTVYPIFILSCFFIYEIFLFLAFRTLDPTAPKEILRLQSNFQSKQLCSCLFVMEQKEDFCMDYVKDPRVPDFILRKEIDEKNRRVSVKNFLTKSAAVWIDSRSGCQLEL